MSTPESISPAASALAGNLRALRQRRELSIGALAAIAGMSKATLSKLERGVANPTLETLETLATALSVELTDLVGGTAPNVQVVRAGGGLPLDVPGAVGTRQIHVLSRDRLLVEVHELSFAPGHREVSATHGEGSWEHAIVRSGAVEAGPVGHIVQLSEGDYAVYPADRPHVWRCLGAAPAVVWVVLTVAHRDR